VQETGQIPDRGFYLPIFMSRDDPVVQRFLSISGGQVFFENEPYDKMAYVSFAKKFTAMLSSFLQMPQVIQSVSGLRT